MKVYTLEEITKARPTGDLMLLYGDTNVGKTVTTMQTAPQGEENQGIDWLMMDPKDVRKAVVAANRPDINIRFSFWEGWDNLLEHVLKPENLPGQSLVIDTFSHLIAICLSDELETEAYGALESKLRSEQKRIDKPIIQRSKLSEEGFGSLAREMLRFTQAVALLAQQGKTVICLARLESAPKWNRDLQAAPAFKGREYAKHFAGFFDFIGLVEQRVDKKGNVIYPPLVSFQDDGSFVSRWSGIMPEKGVIRKPLNIEKILEASHGAKQPEKGEK